MKSISRMYYLIINKNLDPLVKPFQRPISFWKKEREREENVAYRSHFNQVTISTTLPPSLPLLLRSFHRFTGTTRRSKTIERGNSLRETIGRQGERVRREDKSLSVLHVKR